MTITEKVAYLKGLMEGLELDTSSKEGKVLKAVVDVLDDMALSVTDIEDDLAELSDQVDEIDEDLSEVEDEVFGDADECCDCDDDDCDCCDGDDDDFYEVTCSKCGETTYITGAILDEGKMDAPTAAKNWSLMLWWTKMKTIAVAAVTAVAETNKFPFLL